MRLESRHGAAGEWRTVVIAERFAWAHLPKTGGDTTRELFELFPALVLHADPGDTNDKHALFSRRRAEIEGKTLAMNFRRLPAWVLSRGQHLSREGLYPEYEPLPVPSAAEMACTGIPDERLLHFTDHWRLEITAWLRLEHLREDFIAFVSRFVELGPDDVRRVHEHPARDVADYDRRLESWFSPGQLEEMYQRNPRWAALEQELYGNLLDGRELALESAR
jgi:hypothetical protein